MLVSSLWSTKEETIEGDDSYPVYRNRQLYLTEMYPYVQPLQLHLPIKHLVTYQQYQSLDAVLKNPNVSKTMLTEFLDTNMEDEEARRYLNHEFPEHYV